MTSVSEFYIKVQESSEIWGRVAHFPEASDLLGVVAREYDFLARAWEGEKPIKMTRTYIRTCVGRCEWMDLDGIDYHWHEVEDGQGKRGATPAWKLWE